TVDTIHLYKFNGFGFSLESSAPIEGNTATMKVERSKLPRFYYIGVEQTNLRPILLGTEPDVLIDANCQVFRAAKVPGSTVNTQYDEVKDELNRIKGVYGQMVQQYRMAGQNENLQQELERRMAELDEEKLH